MQTCGHIMHNWGLKFICLSQTRLKHATIPSIGFLELSSYIILYSIHPWTHSSFWLDAKF